MTDSLRCTLLVLLALLGGCSMPTVSDYTNNSPRFDLYQYFQGDTTGWGIVQDRSGRLTRQFVVRIRGTVDSQGRLTLDEDFSWSDGERSQRIWTIEATAAGSYRGQATDVRGDAVGQSAGNALHWRYRLEIPVSGHRWLVTMDDWMFLQPDEVLLNRTRLSKFGIYLGEVTIVFNRGQRPH